MKEQPIEAKEHVIGHSIGQRPIHTTYEPPGPLPQFRARPKLSPVQPQPQPQPQPKSVPKRLNLSKIVKPTQSASPEASSGRETTAPKKSS